MMEVEILYFAHLKDALGAERETVRVAEGSTVGDVVSSLRKRPAWVAVEGLPLSLAVNEEIVRADRKLCDGDRIALLPPVSGG